MQVPRASRLDDLMIPPTLAEQKDRVRAFLKESGLAYPVTIEEELCQMTKYDRGWMVEVDLKVLVDIDRDELTKMRERFESGLN